MVSKFNPYMSDLRENILKDIYNRESVSEAELNLTDLFIYSKNNTFFARLNKVLNISMLDSNIILTDEQVECLNILEQNNLFLSAPTSFGKTYIALEHIARHCNSLNNIVFVVPTISLMNELRKKCFEFFFRDYIIITSDAELEQYSNESKKIIIVVPERINTRKFRVYLSCNNIDLLVYDEIYKLKCDKSERDTNDRIIKMNYIYKYLVNKSDKILLLGPFIKDVNFEKSKIEIKKYITNLNLVYNDIVFDVDDSFQVLEYSNEKKFVYFNSPASIKRFLNGTNLSNVENGELKYDEEIIEWISNNVHSDWYYSTYLKLGIGIHHGKTPVFLRKYIEHEYSKADGLIHTILCTSTLMEGINTPTNKLIIHDAPRGTFELNNLIGRVGRLNINDPKAGKVYVLDRNTINLYDPKEWIKLNILYETPDIITNNKEDEILYLDKKSIDGKLEDSIEVLKSNLKTKFGIDLSEVIESGIEFNLLSKFIYNFDTITNYTKEWDVINNIKFKLLRNDNSYLTGLEIDTYSFNDGDNKYIFDAVYKLIINGGKMKPIIDEFEKKYDTNPDDINIFIDTLFKIDEFIKFKMMKIVSLYELFNAKHLFDKISNRAFIQSIHMIESYYDSPDGYERILGDMGIPKEDIDSIANIICTYDGIKGTENKLKKLKSEEIFRDLSPFSKIIIKDL